MRKMNAVEPGGGVLTGVCEEGSSVAGGHPVVTCPINAGVGIMDLVVDPVDAVQLIAGFLSGQPAVPEKTRRAKAILLAPRGQFGPSYSGRHRRILDGHFARLARAEAHTRAAID